MPVYSFGKESPMKFEIPEKLAHNYNEAVKQFFAAQRRFQQKFGKSWDMAKSSTITIDWTKAQRKAWNEFAEIFNAVNKKYGPFQATDLMEDFLVLNSVVPAKKTNRLIAFAVVGGAIYGYFRGR